MCAFRRREILIFALRTGGGVLTGMHVIFNYVTNVAVAVGNADKFTEILLKFYSPDYPCFTAVILIYATYKRQLIIALTFSIDSVSSGRPTI